GLAELDRVRRVTAERGSGRESNHHRLSAGDSRHVYSDLFGGWVEGRDHAPDATFLPFRSLGRVFPDEVGLADDDDAGGRKRTSVAAAPAARQDAVADSNLRRGDGRGVFEVFGAWGYAEETSGFVKDDSYFRSGVCLDRDVFGGWV